MRNTLKSRAIINRLKKIDARFDNNYAGLRYYLYFTFYYTAGFTISGFVAGATLGAHGYITQQNNEKKFPLVKEPFFQKSQILNNGKAATILEMNVLNIIFCTLLASYEGAKMGYNIGSFPVRYPLQNIISPLLIKMCEDMHRQYFDEIKEGSLLSLFTSDEISPSASPYKSIF